AVPFVADADLGHAGPILGLNATTGGIWHFDPWELYAAKQINSTNVLVIGEFGTGKSGTIKQLCFRSLAFGRQVVVPSDSKAEWVKVAEAAGGQVIRLGGKHTTARLNPLDRGPRAVDASDEEHEVMVASRRRAVLVSLVEATLPADALLTPAEHTALEFALSCAIDASGDEPTLRGVYEQLKTPNRHHAGYVAGIEQDGARARHVLRRFCEGDLAGLFEDRSTVQLDDNAPMVVVDTSALFARGELAATCAQICTTNWIQAVISNKHARRTRFLVREEGWRDMTSVAALQAFRAWLKLSRDYGISVVTLMHKVSDFDAVGGEGSEARSLAYSIFADISNKFIFQQAAAEQGRLVKDLGLPVSHARMVLDLPQGMFLARLGSRRAFVVDAFATSVAIERELFSTDDALVVRTPPVSVDVEHQAAELTDVAHVDVGPVDEAPVDEAPVVEAHLEPPTAVQSGSRTPLRLVPQPAEQQSEAVGEHPVPTVLAVPCGQCGFVPSARHRFCVRCGAAVNVAVS
ncbi:MAG: hypothetical protein K2X97_03745, partial [Mycobacteriaceae bacterium]|nr:hypothetical protein [Mycobacteriaceae bacterium]